MLRKCNNFLICIGVLLSVSCLIFSLAYASNLTEKSETTIIINNSKGKTINKQQKEIKKSLRRMENKIKKRRDRREKRKKHGDV